MLYGKETLILEEVTPTILSNEIRKMLNNLIMKDRVWWSWEGKEEKERKVRVRRRRVTFVTRIVIGRKIAIFDKSG